MRKRHLGDANDGLDLLLDTLCNMFGGIILIACLLALLSKEQNAPVFAEDAGRGTLVERKIENTEAEIAGLKMLLAEVQKEGEPELRQLARERDELRATQDRLRRFKAENENAKQLLAKQSVLDPAQELAQLRSEVRKKELELAQAEADASAVQQKMLDLENRISRIQSETTDLENRRVVKLRFPKERTPTKEPFPVILCYGQVFPLTGFNGAPFGGVDFLRKRGESFQVQPKRGEGFSLPLNAEILKRLVSDCNSSGSYLALYVYPDTFEAFRELKLIMHEVGCEYGVDACEDGEVLRFGPDGDSPAPL